MITYIAFLRGINVGGKNKVKMEVLKQMFERLDLYSVQTYIQSGNVIFKSAEEAKNVRQRIEYEFEQNFGFPVMVLLRTIEELEELITLCPFSKEDMEAAGAQSAAESLYVAFLEKVPSNENIEKLRVYRRYHDEYRIDGKEVFLLFRSGIRNSKLANNLHKLDVAMTIRNWKTINKLVTLGHAIE